MELHVLNIIIKIDILIEFRIGIGVTGKFKHTLRDRGTNNGARSQVYRPKPFPAVNTKGNKVQRQVDVHRVLVVQTIYKLITIQKAILILDNVDKIIDT